MTNTLEENDIINNLQTSFPDKNVISSKLSKETEKDIQKLAKTKKMNIRDYLMVLGFSYNNVSFEKRLTLLFPSKTVIHMHEKDSNAYRVLIARALSEKKSVKDYLESIGFKYEASQEYELKEIEFTPKIKKRSFLKSLQEIAQGKTIKPLNESSPIFKDISILACFNNMSINEMLSYWGYQYLGLSADEVLAEMYPDNLVYDLKSTNEALYEIVKEQAKLCNKKLADYFSMYNIEYIEDTNRVTESNYLKILKIKYPDNVVRGLETGKRSMYLFLAKKAKENNSTIKDELAKYGYSFVTLMEEKKNHVISKLAEMYPDKKVQGLLSRDKDLYNMVVLCAQDAKTSIIEFMKIYGFEYISPKPVIRKFKLDNKKKAELIAYYKSKGIDIEEQ